MSKKRDSRLVGDRFCSRSPQDAGVHQPDSAQATRAEVAKRFNQQGKQVVPNGTADRERCPTGISAMTGGVYPR